MADPDFTGVLALLAEKLGLSPAEFDEATIVIQDGVVRVMPGDCEAEQDMPEPVKTPNAKDES